MNGKFEEKLAQLAFGDVSPDEAASIEAKAKLSPEATRALAEFREMREGLRDLTEVPELQLSKERLRDAILARGLATEAEKEPNRGFGGGWIWMPVAALALGFGLFTLRPRSTPSAPTVVMQDGGSRVADDFHFNVPDPEAFFRPNTLSTAPDFSAGASLPKETPKVSEKRTRSTTYHPRLVSRRHNPSFTDDYQPLKVDKNSWKKVEFAKKDEKASGAKPNATPSPKEQLAFNDHEETPIVLIDSNPDAATGAPTATEVGTASNVLIGG